MPATTPPQKPPHRALYDAFLDALFPPRCAGCTHWSRAPFCSKCAPLLRPICAPLCDYCGAPFDPHAFSAPICAACRARAPHFGAARSAFHFDGPLRQAIHHLKYQQKSALAARLAPFLAQQLFEDATLKQFVPQLLVPVPLHRTRLKTRGFNQSFLLASELGRLIDVETQEILRRTRDTAPQVELGRADRAKNVRGAFAVDAAKNLDASKWQGARILLIDDVFTTGATIGEAAKTLKLAGAGEICALTLGRQA
ncbi:comF family protein [Abditibacterium utsteinense]|uniref:ComF family protein n=1 Tax=Abditibacterium utsteinense TaxID=1960156 RepID=A0A2S8SWC5_9BACT|nr:ComF family protein [Abditibacterium utsteinense]PQV65105.1 comF family protein [Abditibacterium utsteinense]